MSEKLSSTDQRDSEASTRIEDVDKAHDLAQLVDGAETARAEAQLKLNLAATALKLEQMAGYVRDTIDNTSPGSEYMGSKLDEWSRNIDGSKLTDDRLPPNRVTAYKAAKVIKDELDAGYRRGDILQDLAEKYKEKREIVENAYKEAENPNMDEIATRLGLEPGEIKFIK